MMGELSFMRASLVRLEPHFGGICKQFRPRSDAAGHGVRSGSTLLAYRNVYAKY